VPATVLWNGPAGGDWNNPSNWVGGTGVPGSGDSAVIGMGSSVVITETPADAVYGISLAPTASLDIQAGTAPVLTVLGTFVDQGNLNVGGTLQMGAGSTMTISGDLAITGSGTFSSAGTVEVASGSHLDIEVGAVNSNFGTMTFTLDSSSSSIDLTGGTQQVEYSGAFVGFGGGTISLSGGTIEVGDDATSTYSASFDFSNPGGLSWSGGEIDSYVGGTFTNLGEIVVSGPTVTVGNVGEFDNQGQMQFTDGSDLSYDPESYYGTWLVNENSGQILKPVGSGTAEIDVTIQNYGTVEADAGVLYLTSVQNLGGGEEEEGFTPDFQTDVTDLNTAYNANTLSDGTWIARNAQLQFSQYNFDDYANPGIGTNNATIILDGSSAAFQVPVEDYETESVTLVNPLSSLTYNGTPADPFYETPEIPGSLTLLNGASINDNFDFQNDGTLVLGTSAILNLQGTPDGGFFQTSNGSLTILVGGSWASGLFGQIQASQPSSLDGTLTATVINGYTPLTSDVYPIIVTPGLTGTFATTQIAPFNSLQSDTTFFLLGTGTTSSPPPFLVVPPSPPLVVPPATPANNPPSGGGNTSVNPPTDGPASSDPSTGATDQGGGSGGAQEVPREISPLTSGNSVALYFQNLQWSLEVRMSDLSSMLGPTSAYTTPPAGEGTKSKSADGNVTALPPMLRFFIAAAGVGPANVMTSVNDGSTNVDQVYSILDPQETGALGGGTPAAPKNPGAPARTAPMPVRDAGGADGAPRLGEPEESEGMARMLAVFSLALYHACASSISARSPTARGAAVNSSPWRSAR
jgi:hypothetical protein